MNRRFAYAWPLVAAATALVAIFLATLGRALPVSAARASLVVLATEGDVTTPIEIVIARSDGRLTATARAWPTASAVHHADGGMVRGALTSAHEVLVVAQGDDRDPSFASDLWIASRSGARRVLGGLAIASKPLVVGRRAYLQTGQAGTTTTATLAREDEVAITELDLDSGTSRTAMHFDGQLAYPIGVDDDLGLVTYLIGGPGSLGEGGRLVAFDRSGRSRDLGRIGTARDFSLVPEVRVEDRLLGPSIVYEAISPQARRVEVMALDSSVVTAMRDRSTPMAPFVLPGGQLMPTTRTREGVVEVARAFCSALRAVLVMRYVPGGQAPHFVLRASDGDLVLDPFLPPGARWEPVGFAETP